MRLSSTQCCGIQEISALSTHTDAPDAMSGFCRNVFGDFSRTSPFDKRNRDIAFRNYMYSFYLFTAAVYEDTKHKRYGQEFADFIKANKLGQVSTTRARTNYSFHPDHKVQAWLWRPNLTHLKKWWTTQLLAVEAQAKPANP